MNGNKQILTFAIMLLLTWYLIKILIHPCQLPRSKEYFRSKGYSGDFGGVPVNIYNEKNAPQIPHTINIRNSKTLWKDVNDASWYIK